MRTCWINSLGPLDREVRTLRHGDRLSHDETATVLGIPQSQASESSIWVLRRSTLILAALPGFKGKP